MSYPVRPVVKPSGLAGFSNGKLPESALVNVPMPQTSRAFLYTLAARAWTAMAAAALNATGVVLTCTSWVDTYREYRQQLSTFYRRFERVGWAVYAVTPRSKRRTFDDGGGSRYWRLKPGNAPSATPGTSNHGWGLAIDMGIYAPGQPIRNVGTDATLWRWLLANAGNYGFSWESQVENWHVRYVAGDAVPQVVLDYERGLAGGAPPFDPSAGQFGLWPLNPAKRTLVQGCEGDDVRYLQGVLGGLTVDGDFGPKTGASVVAFRQFLGDPAAEPVVGPTQWHVIDLTAARRSALV